MSVVIVGGGVVGVTTAYYLARAGFEVTVIEQNTALAQDASTGNAGLIAPGHSFAWAAPGAPLAMVKSLFGTDTAIRVRFPVDRRFVGWGLRFLRECTPGRARANSLAKLALARYSQRELQALAEAEGIDYLDRADGVVFYYRSAAEYRQGIDKMALMRDNGQVMLELDPAAIREHEPALAAVPDVFAGALLGVSDSTGNAVRFTEEIARRCRDLGVTFRLGTRVTGIVGDRHAVHAVRTDAGEIGFDRLIIASGSHSPELVAGLGIHLPVYPAKGYSLTIPVIDESRAPQRGGLDERTLIAWSRMGDAIRVSSTAEFAGFNTDVDRAAIDRIVRTMTELFPGAADWESAQISTSFRPMTPDGPPRIGASRTRGLYYNTGHGHMGWTMACGSAQIITDLFTDATPAIAVDAFTPGHSL